MQIIPLNLDSVLLSLHNSKLAYWQLACIGALSGGGGGGGSHRKYTKGNGNSDGREALNSRETWREVPSWGRHDRVIPGVVTLDRGPDQSPGVRPISPSH